MANGALGQDSLVGQTLGHYRLIERIDQGGQAILYVALDEHLDNRRVAIKILLKGSLADPASRQLIRKEAHALSKLNHPNIATVIDFDSSNGIDYIAEELVEGVSLDEMIAAGPLTEKEIVRLGSQLCEGLAAAHDHGIIHRDIKPGNLRVTPDARLKIIDFGLAKTFHREIPINDETLSASGPQKIVGTWPYMAPEQLRNEKLDSHTDIWAVGCVLFEMATGRRPFLGHHGSLVDEILHQPAPSITRFNPQLSPALDAIIQKCLDKSTGNRYHSARDLSIDLRRLLPRSPTGELRTSNRRRFKLLAASAVIVALVFAGVFAGPALLRQFRNWYFAHFRQQTPPPHALYLQGTQLLERWDKSTNLDSAIRLFRQAVQADPNFALAFSGLGEAYWDKYRLEKDPRWIAEAETNCRHAAELNRQLPAVFVTLSHLHNGRGQYNLALEEIQQALRLAPRDPDALLGEAAVYASMGQDEKARDLFNKAAALRPAYWVGYYELGVFHYRQRRNSEAAAAFTRALGITPDNAVVHATLGGVLQLLRKDAEAEAHLLRSIALQPSYGAYTNLGALYYRQRRWEDSATSTRKALEFNASDWSAWSNLGLASEWLHRNADAAAAYREELVRLEEVAKVKGDDPDIQVELAVLYSKQKLRDKALPLVDAALARAPNDPSILSSATEVYENLGDRNRALAFAEKALANGHTLAQLQNDFAKQKLLGDPRFHEIARKYSTSPSPAHP